MGGKDLTKHPAHGLEESGGHTVRGAVNEGAGPGEGRHEGAGQAASPPCRTRGGSVANSVARPGPAYTSGVRLHGDFRDDVLHHGGMVMRRSMN